MDKIEKTIENTGNAAENVSETSMKAKEIPPSGSWPVLNRQFKVYSRNFCTGIGRR